MAHDKVERRKKRQRMAGDKYMLATPPIESEDALLGHVGNHNARSGRSTPINPDSKSGEGNITGMYSKPISLGKKGRAK